MRGTTKRGGPNFEISAGEAKGGGYDFKLKFSGGKILEETINFRLEGGLPYLPQ